MFRKSNHEIVPQTNINNARIKVDKSYQVTGIV